jgi:hypothetical protein
MLSQAVTTKCSTPRLAATAGEQALHIRSLPEASKDFLGCKLD